MPRIPYKLNGESVPGTTTVIGQLGWNKGALIHWAWKEGVEGRNYRDSQQGAMSIGTLAHELVEKHIRGVEFKKEDYPPDMYGPAKNAFDAFEEMARNQKVSFVETEVNLVSPTLRVGGTPDAIALDSEKRLGLWDWKAANGVYPEYLLQGATYIYLWEETQNAKIRENEREVRLEGGFHLVRFGKEHGDFHHHWWPREVMLDKPLEAFKHMRAMYDLRNPLKRMV
jgi:hypothetical protein